MLLELLMVLAIIGILSGMYLSPPGGNVKKGGPLYYQYKANVAACQANRAVAAIHVADYQITYGRFPSMTDLQQARVSVPGCPEGGRYYIMDGTVYCTVHTEVTIPTPN